eukprot:6771363-Karenia_brevis.AAC.1
MAIWGGCNSGSTAVAHVAASAFADYASSHSLCAIQFFLDVKTAFASMLRFLAVPLDSYDAPMLERLTSLGFTK